MPGAFWLLGGTPSVSRRPEVPIRPLHGNTEGLKPSESKALQALYERRISPDRFVTPEVARRLAELSHEIGRQIGLLVDRNGYIGHVVVGDAHQLHLPDVGRERAGTARFRGLRLVHTHLRGEAITRDDLTDLTLLRLDAVLAIQTRLDGLPGWIDLGTLRPLPEAGEDPTPWQVDRIPSVHGWETDFQEFILDLEAQFSKRDATFRVPGSEGTIIIGVTTGDPVEARESLEELERLAQTAGLQVLDRVLQVRRQFDGRYVIGQGKLKEILIRAMQLNAGVLIFDGELAPSQLRNIATDTDLKVLDRTQLILDIFALRARTREGKLQVELAQLRYMKPRLAIMPTAMSRLTGGIGGRGPGETKLEINKRRAEERVTRLERQLRELSKNRALRRARRKRVGLPQVSIVGYTNAGKSTLLNAMTNASVDAEDKLFATLDPTSRRMRFPEEREVILTDTVGFIRHLPKELMHAFRSTLEEVTEADIILHVVDASSPELETHLATVAETLKGLEASDIPSLLVLNKVDRVAPDQLQTLIDRHGGLPVSALSRQGLDTLLGALERRLFQEQAAARAATPEPGPLPPWEEPEGATIDDLLADI